MLRLTMANPFSGIPLTVFEVTTFYTYYVQTPGSDARGYSIRMVSYAFSLISVWDCDDIVVSLLSCRFLALPPEVDACDSAL